MSKWLFVLFLASVVVACGNKGALYLPDNEKNVETASPIN
ncbi:LPS translocon maturation chaperone LptM [Marinomonas phaeophyticola]